MRDDMRLYQDTILEHYKFPRNKGSLEHPDFVAEQHNYSCGDHIKIEGRVHEGCLVEVAFTGSGCVISQAAASLITQAVKGKSIDEINALHADFVSNLLRISLGPVRLQCALIALIALQEGLRTIKPPSER